MNRLQFWNPPRVQDFPWMRAVVTTRHGGDSAPPYASLNLGLATGDDPDRVHANRARMRDALGLNDVHVLHQVHGTDLWEVPNSAAREGDALWTREPGVAIAVGIADCVPAFLWDARRRTVAVVHAGWRGTAAGILARTIGAWVESGSRPTDLHVALGPCIGPCCYPVSAEVAHHFPAGAVDFADAIQPRLDLRVANRLQAEGAGIPREQIAAAPPCTGCRTDLFFSHRVEGGRTGRQWAIAWIAA